MTGPARKPAVVIIVAALSSGSVGAVAWRHAMELSASFDVIVLSRDLPTSPVGTVRTIRLQPWSWNWLRRFGHVPNELAFLRAARKALRRLAAQQPIDVVWCHSHAAAALAAAPLQSRLGFRVIMTTHGDIFDRPAGTYSRDLTWFYQAVTPRAYRCADFVHVLSPYMGTCAIHGGAAAAKVRFIPNGIAVGDMGQGPASPRQADSFMPGGAPRLLYVGSLWAVKGVEVLLRAMALLRNDATRPLQATLEVVGQGSTAAGLAELTDSLDLTDCVAYAGHVARSDLARHYNRADIMCIPSLSEALPTVALEAMLFGLPVVGSDTGGIPVLVDEGVTGHLAKPGDAASLAQALRTAAQSSEHLARLGAAGFVKVREQFSWQAIAPQLLALVTESLPPEPAPGPAP